MFVGICDRVIRLLIQLSGYGNKLPALIASTGLPKTKLNDCFHLMIITYPEEIVKEFKNDSSNRNIMKIVLCFNEMNRQ